MKRILATILSIVITFSLGACGNNEKAEKYCWSCGEGISKDVAFCEHCGAAVNNEKNESEDATSDNSSSTEIKNEESSIPTESYKPTTSSKPSTPTHTHSFSKTVTAATCTQKGYTTYTCSCGDTYKDDYINSSHSYSKYKCTKCGQLDKTHSYEILINWILENGKNENDYCIVEIDDASAIVYQKAYNYVYLQGTWFNAYNPINNTYEDFFIQIPGKISNQYYFYGEYIDVKADKTLLELDGYLNPKTFNANSSLSYNNFSNFTDYSDSIYKEANRLMFVDIIKYSDLMLQGKLGGLSNSGLTIKDLGFSNF